MDEDLRADVKKAGDNRFSGGELAGLLLFMSGLAALGLGVTICCRRGGIGGMLALLAGLVIGWGLVYGGYFVGLHYRKRKGRFNIVTLAGLVVLGSGGIVGWLVGGWLGLGSGLLLAAGGGALAFVGSIAPDS